METRLVEINLYSLPELATLDIDAWTNAISILADRYGDEWELDKEQLRALKERGDEAFSREAATPFAGYCEDLEAGIDRAVDELKEFVEDCLNAPTGEKAYMTWW